jgi:hypothetical protein
MFCVHYSSDDVFRVARLCMLTLSIDVTLSGTDYLTLATAYFAFREVGSQLNVPTSLTPAASHLLSLYPIYDAVTKSTTTPPPCWNTA